MSKTDAELRLIGQLTRSLEACPEEQRTRILDYLMDRFAGGNLGDDPSDEAESEGRN